MVIGQSAEKPEPLNIEVITTTETILTAKDICSWTFAKHISNIFGPVIIQYDR